MADYSFPCGGGSSSPCLVGACIETPDCYAIPNPCFCYDPPLPHSHLVSDCNALATCGCVKGGCMDGTLCMDAECGYDCDAGYVWDGSTCVPAAAPVGYHYSDGLVSIHFPGALVPLAKILQRVTDLIQALIGSAWARFSPACSRKFLHIPEPRPTTRCR